MGPFTRHLREAIALNRERAPHYAALTGGASRAVSRQLVAVERMLLPVAWWFDRRAAPYHRAGIPLLEALFVPMAGTPPFQPWRPRVASMRAAPPPNVRAIRRRVAAAFAERSFDGAATAIAGELATLAADPQVDCMVRHLLESAHRLAVLAPAHDALATARALPSPRRLLTRLFRMHLAALGAAAALDRRARPLQERGIAILAQDLPPIPLPPGADRPPM